MKHRHADLIKEWADGAKIQVNLGGPWIDDENPTWVEESYRIRPILSTRYAFVSPTTISYSLPDKRPHDNIWMVFDEEDKLIDAGVLK